MVRAHTTNKEKMETPTHTSVKCVNSSSSRLSFYTSGKEGEMLSPRQEHRNLDTLATAAGKSLDSVLENWLKLLNLTMYRLHCSRINVTPR